MIFTGTSSTGHTDLFGYRRSWAVWGAPGDATSPWRYELGRSWGALGTPREENLLGIIGLNPSTATHEEDDPTIRREIRFARDMGYGGLLKANIFAFRSTDPAGLKTCADPVGPLNDERILDVARRSSMLIAAWGCHGILHGRCFEVEALLISHGTPLHVFKLTKEGFPMHPLYLPASTRPVLWEG